MDTISAAPAATAGHELSLVGLFLQADPIVKGVMLLLLLTSVVCWAVVLDKVVKLSRLKRQARQFEAIVESKNLSSRDAAGLTAAILAAAHREGRDRSDETENRSAMRERTERAMRLVMAAELRKLEPGLPLLATVGSAAPFVGLFGTVWGIMNSFTAIAQSNDTSLSVVAPGIAEALFATALGLVAAIPAVIAYNKLATDLGRVGQRLAAAIAAFSGEIARSRRSWLEAAE